MVPKFQSNIWSETVSVIMRNPKVFIGFLAGQVAVSIARDYFQNGGSLGYASLILFAMIAIAVHLTIIRGQMELSGMDPKILYRGYTLRVLAFVATSVAIGFGIAAMFRIASTDLFILLAIVIAGIIYAQLLSFIGTCLPAAATGGDASLAEAIQRGYLTYKYSAIRLFFCLGPVLVIALFGMLAAFGYLTELGTLDDAHPLTITYQAIMLVPSMLGAFNTALASTILSRAYLIGEARRDAGE